MGLSSYPTPSDASILCIILANTAISISIVKGMVRSLLNVIGIHIESSEESSLESSDVTENYRGSSDSYVEAFRSQTPAIRFGSVFNDDHPKQECSVCLVEFEPSSEINHLFCGHVFHKLCVEKWLRYWNVTCPLCREHMMPLDVEEDAIPM